MAANRRGHIPEAQARRVWAASAGRCSICTKYLLEGQLTRLPMTLGELAHIAGATDAPGSPRGNALVPLAERDKAENLMLICAGEHDEIDRAGAKDVLTVEKLQAIKRDHEEWIKTVTGLPRNRATVVIRMVGNVRGNAVELSRETVAKTIVRCDSRFPYFPLSLARDGLEIDLRGLPGEAAGEAIYWDAARAKIDEMASTRLREAVESEVALHLSVFAFARLPLLAYLGGRLGDNVETVVYQRNRASESWDWTEGPTVEFEAGFETEPDQACEEAVLILNVSGTIAANEVPGAIRALPRLVVAPTDRPPSPDIISNRSSLASFAECLRGLLADIEARAKGLQRLHVLAALPMSAAVTLGMVHDAHVHPTLVLYDRTESGYAAVMRVGR